MNRSQMSWSQMNVVSDELVSIVSTPNETHDHAVREKTKVLYYFRFAAQGLIYFLLISISHILGKLCRNLV